MRILARQNRKPLSGKYLKHFTLARVIVIKILYSYINFKSILSSL